MSEIIVLPLLIIVTCMETRAIILALHKKGFTGKDIAASKSSVHQSINNLKERGSDVVKKASGHQRK